ncbi:MAG: aryl-sulfate sulfotransferase [bacterium]
MNKTRTYNFGILFILICFISSPFTAKSYYPVRYLDNPSPGYLLIGPQESDSVALHDNSGNRIYSKSIRNFGAGVNALRMLDNGNFAFYSSSDKWIIMDANLNYIDQISATKPYATDFHTLRSAPNGNYILVGDEIVYVDMSKIVPNGKPNASILNNIIQEFDQNKNLVFEWNCYEHILITDATEDQDLTVTNIDPYHINSVYYDYDGNLLANFRNLDALIKINRATGQIIWVMGGSKSKRNQFFFINDTEDGFRGFSHQHDPKRLPNGNILLFDNGNLKPNPFSRAVEYRVNEFYKTVTKVWEFRHPIPVFAAFQGNAQRLPNGNTMIGWGINKDNRLATEVTSNGKIAMDMDLGANSFSYQVLRNVLMMNTVSRNFNITQLYSFNDGNQITGISVNVNLLTGSGTASVEKHNYAAHYASFNSKSPCSYLPLRWVLNYRNITTMNAKIYFDLNSIGDFNNKEQLKIYWRKYENNGSFTLLDTKYNKDYNRLEANIDSYGEFILGYDSYTAPILIAPENNKVNIPINSAMIWSTKSPTNSFTVQVSLSENFESLVYEKVVNNSKKIECDFLVNNTKYFWRVKGSGSECEAEWSPIYSFTTEIAQPILLKPENKSSNQPLSGTFEWNTISGAKEYGILVSDDSTFTTFILNQSTSDSCHYSYKDLKPLTQYFWRVYASNDLSTRIWSETYKFKTAVGNVELMLPSNLSQRQPTKGVVSWSQLNSIKSYSVQISDDINFLNKLIDTIVTDQTELNYFQFRNSTSYYWRVKGILKDTSTYWSETWQFKTQIGQPTLSYPGNDSKDNPVRGTLEWLFLTDAKSYQVQISYNFDFNKNVIDTNINSTTFNYSSLEFLTNYSWRVRAFDGQEHGDWSDVYSFSTLHELLSPKNNEYKIPLNVLLEWNDSENIKYYEIKIATDSAFTNGTRIFSNINKTEYLVDKLENNTTYYWSVRTKKMIGFSPWSEPFMFTTLLVEPVLSTEVEVFTDFMTKIDFKWEHTEGVEYYQLQISNDSSFNNIIYNKDRIEAEEYSVELILTAAEFYWRVKAFNSNNESMWSDYASFKINFMSVEDINSVKDINLYPNPGKDYISFDFNVSIPDLLNIQIVDMQGKTVSTIDQSFYNLGYHSLRWDSKDVNGNDCKDGKYYLIIKGKTVNKSYPIVILK